MRGRERRPHPRLPLTRSTLGVARVSPTLGRGTPGLREGLRPSDAWSRAGRPHQVVIHPGGASHPASPGVTSLLGSFVACASTDLLVAAPFRGRDLPGRQTGAPGAPSQPGRSRPLRGVTPRPLDGPRWAACPLQGSRVLPRRLGPTVGPLSAALSAGKDSAQASAWAPHRSYGALGGASRSCPPWVAGCAAFAAGSPLRSQRRP